MKLRAIRDEVLVERIVEEESSGLYIPESAKTCMKGKVISLGTKRDKDGNKVDFEVAVGDTIVFPKGTGQLVGAPSEDESEQKLMIRQEDILGVITT